MNPGTGQPPARPAVTLGIGPCGAVGEPAARPTGTTR